MRTQRSIERWLLVLTVGSIGIAALACGGEGADEVDDDLPIVVEDSGPIALADSVGPTADEIDVVEEQPRVVERTVVVRERPRVEPTPVAPAPDPTPAPSRPSAIPAGTSISFSTLHQVDSEHNDVGSTWTGRVTRNVVVGGKVVIPAGATVTGVVTNMNEGDDNGGNGSITLEARSVETAYGTRSIAASPVAGGHSYADKGFPTKETAIGAGAGAVLGGIIGGKKGAAIGAGVGGAGGAAMGQA
ncbi:MAG: YMGG-like glycine zipper-containing protein, partial [Gemmatimonadota bacterium]